MTGVVTAEREATLPITVVGPQGRTLEFDAVVDTGFNGYLTLPQSLVRELELLYHSESVATLGDGTVVRLSRYEAAVLWEGRQREIMALAADGGPLIGMSLLHNSRVIVDVITGGRVAVEPLGERS